MSTGAIDVAVGGVVASDFGWVRLDLSWLEGVAGCGSGATLAAEFGSGKALRLLAVARSGDLLATEASPPDEWWMSMLAMAAELLSQSSARMESPPGALLILATNAARRG